MTAIILAGGKSSRFGESKALQVIGGKSVIQRVVDSLSAVCAPIIVATAHGEAVPCSSTAEIVTVADIYPAGGALAGIHSALTASRTCRAVVVGCDMPFLSIGLLRHMCRISSAYDAVVPRVDDNVEPLCAVYSRNCLGPIRTLLDRHELRVDTLFSMVKVRYVGKDEIDRFDPEHLGFFNINSRADLEKARAMASAGGLPRDNTPVSNSYHFSCDSRETSHVRRGSSSEPTLDSNH